MSLKPSNLHYGVDETPPLWVTFILGLQHISVMATAWVFPVIVGSKSGATSLQIANLVSMSILAGGIGIMLQALHSGPVGSGYLCPQVCGPSYLSASMLAARMGGIPLVLGMTMCAGSIESLFSRAIKRLRFMFPVEVTGLIVAMVGITIIRVASSYFLALGEIDQAKGIFVSCIHRGFKRGSALVGLDRRHCPQLHGLRLYRTSR